MEYLVVLIVGLIGYIIYGDTKRKSAESLIENFETKNKLNESDKNIAKNEGLEQVEQQKRDYLQEHLDKEKNSEQGDDLEKLRDFFNDPGNNTPK